MLLKSCKSQGDTTEKVERFTGAGLRGSWMVFGFLAFVFFSFCQGGPRCSVEILSERRVLMLEYREDRRQDCDFGENQKA